MSRGKYKKITNAKSWGRLIQPDLLGSGNVLRETTDDDIRMDKWGAMEVQMGRCRAEHYQGNQKLRKGVRLLGGMIYNREVHELDTDVE